MAAPSDDLFEWASDANWSTGAASGFATKGASPPSGAEIAQGLVPGTGLRSELVNATLDNFRRWLEFVVDDTTAIYGDGSDGNFVFDSGDQLTKDTYYNDVHVESTGELNLNGYRLFVSGTITIDAGGIVHADGAPGTTDFTTPAGGAGASAGSVLGGGAGGSGGTDASNNGVGGTDVEDSLGGDGGSGSALTPSPGVQGFATAPIASRGGYRHLDAALGQLSGATRVQFTGGAGGGGGGAEDLGATAGAGGGGGGGGGVAIVFARTLINNGAIRAHGGAGGNGSIGTGPGGGGGGGGGGGVVFVVSRRRSGSGTVTATGGAAGLEAFAGGDGTAGDDGTVIELTA